MLHSDLNYLLKTELSGVEFLMYQTLVTRNIKTVSWSATFRYAANSCGCKMDTFLFRVPNILIRSDRPKKIHRQELAHLRVQNSENLRHCQGMKNFLSMDPVTSSGTHSGCFPYRRKPRFLGQILLLAQRFL